MYYYISKVDITPRYRRWEERRGGDRRYEKERRRDSKGKRRYVN